MSIMALGFPEDIQPWEEFKDITENEVPGVQPIYKISNLGRVWNSKQCRYLTQTSDKDGYQTVSLLLQPEYITGSKTKRCKVHRLLMLVHRYVEGCENLVVNHRNNIPTDNYIRKSLSEEDPFLYTNLEWCTAAENSHHARRIGAYDFMIGENNIRNKLSVQDVEQICQLLEKREITDAEIARRFNVSQSSIYDIKVGKVWRQISCKYNL